MLSYANMRSFYVKVQDSIYNDQARPVISSYLWKKKVPVSQRINNNNTTIQNNHLSRSKESISFRSEYPVPTSSLLSGIVGTSPGRSRRALIDRLARDIQTQTTNSTGDAQDNQVDNEQDHLLPVGKPLALVHDDPEDGGESVAEPAAEEGADQTEQVVEDRDRLGDDPRDGPGR